MNKGFNIKNRILEFEALLELCFIDKNECKYWSGIINEHGYGRFDIHLNDKKEIKAHRISWMYHNNLNPIPNNLFVLHKCDERQCVNPSHLYLGNNDDNMNDMVNRGRSTKGRKVSKGFTGQRHTEETKRKMSIAKKQGGVV